MKHWESSLLMDFYGALLTPYQRQVMRLYYEDDLSLGEIATSLGVSRQGIHDVVRRANAQLEGLEAKLALAARFKQTQGVLAQVAELVEKLPQGPERDAALSALEGCIEQNQED